VDDEKEDEEGLEERPRAGKVVIDLCFLLPRLPVWFIGYIVSFPM